jgi:lipopolysaccharide/colanic/teichoic acid biosynthesis glycosyltransferase
MTTWLRLTRILRGLAVQGRQLMSRVHSPGTWTQPGIYSVEQFQAALEREKARAERNGHSVCLVTIQTGGRCTRERPRLEDVLRGRLRIMDEAGWFDRSRIGVLMPYTSAQGAWRLIGDMCRLMRGTLSPSDCRVYRYPHDQFDRDESARESEEIVENETRHAGAVSGLLTDASCARGDSEDAAEALPGADPFGSRPGTAAPLWQRSLDILGSLLGLMVLWPVLLATALVIKLVSPGPVFFKQVRLGRGGTPFLLWKFRTMEANADTSVHRNHVAELIRSAQGDGAAKPMTKLGEDPRVIPFGRILRGICVDELPQLINVLRGEMSLVGPRPPIPYEVHEYLPWQKRRLDTTPGLTGLWQVSGKNRLTFNEMVRLDIRYCRTKCLWKAVAILCRTPRAIVQEVADVWAR